MRYANQLPEQVEGLIVRLKAEKPHWGARKIRELLVRRLDGDIRVPAKSTIHAVLDRHGLVERAGGSRLPPSLCGGQVGQPALHSVLTTLVIEKNLFNILSSIEHTYDFRPTVVQTIKYDLRSGGE